MVKLTVKSQRDKRGAISASCEILGQVSGSLLGGYSGGRWGPRRTILASCLGGGLGWLIISLIVNWFVPAGMGPLMWVFIAEMLPREYKVLSGIVSSAGLFVVFAVTKTFPTLTTLTSPLQATTSCFLNWLAGLVPGNL